MREGWTIQPLGELCDFQRGLSYAKSDEVEFSANVVLRATNIDLATNLLDFSELRYIRDDVAVPDSKKVRKNSLMICTASGSRSHLGKVAFVDEDYGHAYGGFMGLITPKNAVLPRYLYYLMTSETYGDFLGGLSGGTNINNLKFSDLKQFPVPYPPLPEQRRIVAILDEAFEAIAAAKANAARNLQNARALFEANLGTVFSQLEGDVVPIGKVGQVFDGPHATPKTVDSGPVFLGIGALQDGEVSLGATRHVTPEDFQRWTLRVKPQPGDFVFSYETRLGQAAVIPDGLECCLGRRMGLVRFNPTLVDAHFFAYQYVAPPYREFLGTKTLRGATVDRISVKDFPSFPVTVPPLDEQQRIVGRLKLLRVQVESLASLYQQKVAALEALKKSLLHQAFTGQLTSQAA